MAAVMDRQVVLLRLLVPWGEHSEVYELDRWLTTTLASEPGVTRVPLTLWSAASSTIVWESPAELTLAVRAESEGAALDALRAALAGAPVRVQSVDVIADDDDGGA